jgi:phosphopantothenoylcysteine decarboxylase/phosphopantothenate--cysteine ligase
MQLDLNNRSILIGVTGSISAYKACDLVRLFVKSGADVHVVMTPSATRFVSSLTFEALTRNPVLNEESESWSSDLNHIEIGKKCNIFIIAPATANSINKLSKGIADNILLQTALAFTKEILIAPSANTQMLQNHYTTGSLKMLAVNDYTIVEPQEKLLACGDIGSGALADPIDIYMKTSQMLLTDKFWKDRRIVITGGGTREKVDEVRYISNFSSGKMANSLALALYSRGADVCYITTTDTTTLPSDIYTISVESAEEMLEYTIDAIRVAKKGKMSKATINSSEPMHLIQKEPYLFMVAAVSDYRPKFPQKGKLKKSLLGEDWSLQMDQNRDILSTIDKSGIKVVAFKAEMDDKNGKESARELLTTKEVDSVCYNHLQDSESFGSDENSILFITKDSEVYLEKVDKLSLAFKILDEAKVLSV